MTDDPFNGLDTIALAQMVKSGRATALEVTDAAIAQIERTNPLYNFMTTCDFDRARKRARNAPRDTPFAGVPFLMKDMIDVAGLPRTDGSKLLVQNVPTQNVAYVDAIERAGLNILGLTNVPEFAAGVTTDNAVFGATKNPLNPEFSTFTSSGGSAAAIACGAVSMAHGTDGGGSNRLPASATGLFGMKPSYARMLSGEADGGHDIAKTNHVLSRTVRESALLFSLTEDPAGPLSPTGFVAGPSRQRLRIGILADAMYAGHDTSVVQAQAKTASVLQDLGHQLVEVTLPLNVHAFTEAYIHFFSTRLHALRQMIETNTGLPIGETDWVTPLVASGAEALRHLPETDVARSMRYLHELKHSYAGLFTSVDVLLTPVSHVVCPRLCESSWEKTWTDELASDMVAHLQHTAPVNFAGCPAVSVPCNVDAESGLPIGSHLVAAIGQERILFEIAYELEPLFEPAKTSVT